MLGPLRGEGNDQAESFLGLPINGIGRGLTGYMPYG
jgi:hypothetical protein